MTRPIPALAAAFAAALLAGCRSAPPSGEATDYRVADGYAGRRPADVAVLPVGGELPPEAAAALREALRGVLLERRYAPVRVREVDGRPEEFRVGGPSAVLEVTVERWDEASLFGTGRMRFSGTARLVGPGSAENLYEVRLAEVEVNGWGPAWTMEERPSTRDRAARHAAERLLAMLPAKGDG